jgi:hypothetical protein
VLGFGKKSVVVRVSGLSKSEGALYTNSSGCGCSTTTMVFSCLQITTCS